MRTCLAGFVADRTVRREAELMRGKLAELLPRGRLENCAAGGRDGLQSLRLTRSRLLAAVCGRAKCYTEHFMAGTRGIITGVEGREEVSHVDQKGGRQLNAII